MSGKERLSARGRVGVRHGWIGRAALVVALLAFLALGLALELRQTP